MAYKINDEIFFLKIDEQVEYLTQVINELYSKDIKIINTNINNLSERINNLNDTKQDKTSDELKTEVKNIVGSINELFDKIESETNRAVNSENEISTNLTEFKDHTNTILDSHTSSISSINDSINSLQDNKQSKIDEQLQTTSKEVVGAINENHDAIVTNEVLIDTKQDKTDNSLATTNKTIVGAINEVNNKIFTDENIDEIKKELNGKVNKSDIVNTHVGMSTAYPMTQAAVKNNFWNTVPIDNEVGPSKPAVSNRLFKTGLYVTVPLDNTAVPPTWNPNYDPCPGGTGYGTLLNLVNNCAAGIYRQQAQFYCAETPKNRYWRYEFNGQNHSDTSNWGSWKRLVSSDELNSKQDKASAFPYLALNGGLRTKRASDLGWGNQTGSPIVGYGDSSEGGIMLRKDCPSAGKMSLIIDGTVYTREGSQEVVTLAKRSSGSYVDCCVHDTGIFTIIRDSYYIDRSGYYNINLPFTFPTTNYTVSLTCATYGVDSIVSFPQPYITETSTNYFRVYVYLPSSLSRMYLNYFLVYIN